MINVYYVHTDNTGASVNSRRPDWFSHDKCFHNFLSTLNLDSTKLTVSFDGDPSDFIQRFRSHDKWDNIKIVDDAFHKSTSHFSFIFDLIDEDSLPEDDWIYILENDYLHANDWDKKILELSDSNIKFDYVSLYDHLDKYYHADKRRKQKSLHKDLHSQIFVSASHHWRTVPSTCGSWAFKVSTFLEDKQVFYDIPEDHKLFTYLRKEKGRSLISAVPGLSTHCVNEYMSPAVDWKRVQHESTPSNI
tara:strand:- start:993 stop:1733 length:741 start_codon:yes stop_codon:yes gene_type:complete